MITNSISKTIKAAAGCLLLLLLLLYPQARAGEESLTVVSRNNIQVEITTHLGDRQTFQEGDIISFFLSLDRDAFVIAIYEDASHHRIQIIPNAKQEDNFYAAGLFIPLPGHGAQFRFKVSAPFGRETLWVFASETPISQLEGETLENGLKLLQGNMAALKSQISSEAQTAFGESHLSIFTKAMD